MCTKFHQDCLKIKKLVCVDRMAKINTPSACLFGNRILLSSTPKTQTQLSSRYIRFLSRGLLARSAVKCHPHSPHKFNGYDSYTHFYTTNLKFLLKLVLGV